MRVHGVEDRAAFADVMATLGAAAVTVMGLALLIGSHDSGMAFHGLLFLLAGAASAIYILTRAFDDDARMADDYALVKEYIGLDKEFDVKTAYTNEFLDRSIKMTK